MEVRRFWFLNSQIERLRAEEQIVFMRSAGSLTTPEGFEKTYEHYLETLGVVATFEELPTRLNLDDKGFDPEFDREAYLAFRRMFEDNR